MRRLSILLTLCTLALVVSVTSAKAQYYQEKHSDDTQLHTGAELSVRYNERWGVTWGEELYFGNNISRYDKLYTRLMVSYYLTPNLRIAPMAMLIANYTADTRTMVYDLNLFYTHKFDRLSLTLRGGLRCIDLYYPTRESAPFTIKSNPELMLRGQVGATYKLTPHIEPYANIEAFGMLNPATYSSEHFTRTVGYYLPRVRSNVGVKFRINQMNAISLYWRYDHTQSKYISYELADAPCGFITKSQTANMVGVFYHLSF